MSHDTKNFMNAMDRSWEIVAEYQRKELAELREQNASLSESYEDAMVYVGELKVEIERLRDEQKLWVVKAAEIARTYFSSKWGHSADVSAGEQIATAIEQAAAAPTEPTPSK